MNGGGGLFSVVVQRGFSSMGIACIITMSVLTCLDSCKHRFSLVTWLASVMASFSCLGWLVSVLPCSLSDTYTAQSSVNRSSKFHTQSGTASATAQCGSIKVTTCRQDANCC
ncbi:hypothetical protein L1987_37018 [Smallanthus sonchifolius]|uniref:Uncharacterized protein n=1 Tax=Smallanthus sonchifolius TaxID=185202 RepID=A0ACB9HFM5_9ASTR|nr:hypothetical protein L1987_37018 [Smallanthus sonchifolius]